MSETTTLEERTSALQTAIVEASRLPPRHVSWIWDDAISEIIAAAIREAENAAHERAAMLFDCEEAMPFQVAEESAGQIRALKSPSPPKESA